MDAVKTGSYLAALRRSRGWTQQETAERLGVSNKTISKWESGGGFPDITVLPALAELYGVTADDILVGETLAGERRGSVKEQVTAQRKRLLSRLRTRFDMCFALSLALACVARLGIPYVSLAALPLAVAMGWIGFILVTHPVRYGGIEVEGSLWLNLLRKLLIASAVQWYALLCMTRFGDVEVNWGQAHTAFSQSPVLRGRYDDWKPLVFFAGTLLLCVGFQLAARHLTGPEARLFPGRWQTWLTWAVWLAIFWAAWNVVDGRFDEVMAPWAERYGPDVLRDARFDTHWPKLKARRDAEVLPWLWARRAVLSAGGLSGLGLAVRQLWKRKKEN